MPTKLIDASTDAIEVSSIAYVNSLRRRERTQVPCSCIMSSTGTIVLQGRMTNDDDWHTLDTYTGTENAMVQLMPQMRTSMVDNIGTVSLWIDV